MEMPEPNITVPNNTLVATIVIQMHGTVITYDLGPSEATLFENVRLLCKAGGLKPNYQVALNVVDDLREIFGKDMNSTYDIIKNPKSGLLLDTVSFDKTLSTRGRLSWNPLERWNGIYLLSIHKGRKLIYPADPSEPLINFLNVEDLHRLEAMFPDHSEDDIPFPNLEDDTLPFPNQGIYVEEENRIIAEPSLSEDAKAQKIKKIRAQFMKLLSNWKLTLDSSGNIEIIKLSYLVKLIKSLLGNKVIINLLDYSCNNPSAYIPEETQHLSKYIFQDVGNDYDAMERGLMGQRRLGGTKHTKHTKHRKNKRLSFKRKRKRTKKRRTRL